MSGKTLEKIDEYISNAVSHYWLTRQVQRDKQEKRGTFDAGLRSAVTGGAQMDGFISLFKNLIIEGAIDEQYIYEKKRYELFCRKLILERHYTSSSFITSAGDTGIKGTYSEPTEDLSFKKLARALVSHSGAFI